MAVLTFHPPAAEPQSWMLAGWSGGQTDAVGVQLRVAVTTTRDIECGAFPVLGAPDVALLRNWVESWRHTANPDAAELVTMFVLRVGNDGRVRSAWFTSDGEPTAPRVQLIDAAFNYLEQVSTKQG